MIRQALTIEQRRPATRERRKSSALHEFLKPFASLRLTVVLLALTTILVYVGTSVQKEMGIWDVQRKFFHSFWVWTDLRLFFPLWSWGFEKMPGRIPLPGGYTLIIFLLINLLAAHTVRFKLNWKRSGIIVIHAGIILLIVGEVITAVFAREGQMVIDEGQTVSFVQDIREAELAIVDPSSPDHDVHVVIPAARLVKQDTISYPTLPFAIRVDKYFLNSFIAGPFQLRQMDLKEDARATAGAGVGTTVVEQPPANGVESEMDAPSAYVTLLSGGQDLGTFLVSTWYNGAQEFQVGGKTYTIQLRWTRSYKPYSLTLHDFTHDRYTGTDVPKNFASRVQLIDPTRNENREVKIWMNHPLRYAGETFFQASFKRGDQTTILQVVKNPGWLLPYIACTAVSLGLLMHFGMVLINFLSRTLAPVEPASTRPSAFAPPPPLRRPVDRTPWFARTLIPACIGGICVLLLLTMGKPPRIDSPFDYNAFGRVPINWEGRVMPLDTLARVSLRIISNKSDIRLDDGAKVPAIKWLAGVIGHTDESRQYKIFRIDNPDLLSLLNLDDSRKLFAFDELTPSFPKIEEQMQRINQVNKKDWNVYQRKMSELYQHLVLFTRLEDGRGLYIAPPIEPGEDWKTLEEAMRESQTASAEDGLSIAPQKVNPGLAAYRALLGAYHNNRSDMFNSAARDYIGYLSATLPAMSRRVDFEVLFNYFDPFVTSMYFYVAAFLVMLLALLFSPAQTVLRRSALAIIIVTFVFHTIGLLGRIYIQGRPPVTNLYSSAIFIGWGAVGVSIVLELIFRNGIGNLVAPLIAFPTLVIAHYLAGSGDTMQMLQAVLDTNIWLATHVLAVTMGYTATFVAGVLAIVFLIGSVFLRRDVDTVFHRAMGKMIYGTLCFALLFSFVGTVLGGIWADQSWGRFWGWDPKENGAVMIVLWNAIVLHARWAGMVRTLGIAVLAIVGNIVTGWSWFGTNLMGVGLHSYGFMDSGVFWLGLFAATQVFIMLLSPMRGMIPLNRTAQPA